MSLNGKYVSCKEVIGELYRDRKYKYQLSWSDSLEWSVDAIQLIGAPSSLQPRVAKITIDNYRGILPCDLESITQAAGSYSGCAIFPMTTSTGSFHPVHICDDTALTTLIEEFNQTSTTATELPIGQDISGNPVYTFQNGNMSMPEGTFDNAVSFNGDKSTYNVNGNFVFTNYSSGCVYLAYKALPVDEEGYPLIPDNRRFKEAIKAFIGYKIDYILYRSKELDKDIYDISEREWLFYVASAGNVAKMPNYDQMQSIMNQMKLIPQRYSHGEFFKSLGS